MRKVSQTFTSSNSGNKRQRVISPAAPKAIDTEDEPKGSISHGRQGNGAERRVLSGIQNI